MRPRKSGWIICRHFCEAPKFNPCLRKMKSEFLSSPVSDIGHRVFVFAGSIGWCEKTFASDGVDRVWERRGGHFAASTSTGIEKYAMPARSMSNGGKNMTDFYVLLGVARSANASEIRRAYIEKAQRLHPDRNPSAKPDAMQQLNAAYEVLGCPYQPAALRPDAACQPRFEWKRSN